MTLKQMADGFTGSAEFQQKYGALDNWHFVDWLNQNVLDCGSMSRSDVGLGFS
jgi:hypothetical protein